MNGTLCLGWPPQAERGWVDRLAIGTSSPASSWSPIRFSLTLDELKGLAGAIRLTPADNPKQVEDIYL